MTSFSLVFDGFIVPEAGKADEVLEVLSQALATEKPILKQILENGSGVLKESQEEDSLLSLAEFCTSLGLRCSVTTKVEETEKVQLESSGAEMLTTESSNESTESNSNSEQPDELDTAATSAFVEEDTNAEMESFEDDSAQSNENQDTDDYERVSDAFDRTGEDEALASAAAQRLEWGNTDALTYIKKSRRAERLVDIASAMIIAFLVVLLSYFVNDDSQFEARVQEQQKYVESLLKVIEANQKEIEQEALESAKEPAIPEAKILTGSEDQPGWHISSEFFTDREQVKLIDIKIETPPPPHLTDEEVVNRVDVRPWLRRLLVSDLAIKQKEGRKFIATGKARAFIEHKNLKQQSLSEVVVTGEVSEKLTEVSGRLMINRGFQQIPQGDQVIVEALPDKTFKYFVAMPFSASFKLEK